MATQLSHTGTAPGALPRCPQSPPSHGSTLVSGGALQSPPPGPSHPESHGPDAAPKGPLCTPRSRGTAPGGNPSPQCAALGVPCQDGQRPSRGRMPGVPGQQEPAVPVAHRPGQETAGTARGAPGSAGSTRSRPENPSAPGPAGCSCAARPAPRQPCPPTWAGDRNRGGTDRHRGEGGGGRRGAQLLTPALPALAKNSKTS